MKVVVLTTAVPFIHGGAEQLRDHLVLNLRKAGAQAEAISIPFSWEPAERLIDEMMIARSLKIDNADRVIALKFPAYLAPHQNKTIWLVHQYRQAYDLDDDGKSNIEDTERGFEIRRLIRASDNRAFAEARALYAVSPVVADRLRRYSGYAAQSLPSPLNDPELFHWSVDDDYLFAGGRVGDAKRQALLLDALAYAPGVRLIMAGPPDTPEELPRLRERAERLGVSDRVTLDIRLLPRADLAALVNRAAGVVYLPFMEDSVGYVTMEAFQAEKPVITSTDSGGVLEIVRDGETGFIANPNAVDLGRAMTRLMSDRRRRREMGRAAKEVLDGRGLKWSETIERLLS